MLSSGDHPVSGTLTATTVAASLGSQACSSLRIQADAGNATNVLIGNSTGQSYALKPDDNVVINCSNVRQIWAKMASRTAPVKPPAARRALVAARPSARPPPQTTTTVVTTHTKPPATLAELMTAATSNKR